MLFPVFLFDRQDIDTMVSMKRNVNKRRYSDLVKRTS